VFDGWGRKFDAALDTRINRALYAQKVFGDADMRCHTLVLEGGALETDGAGTLLATRSSVLDPVRNPDWSERRIEDHLRRYLGIRRFLWLDHGGLIGDDTDAHVDVLARFTDPDTIVYSAAPEGDADHPALSAMLQQLRDFRASDGTPYRLHALPFPGVHRDDDGRRLPASYANFLITNQSVLVPVYGVAADAEAISLLQARFPERAIKAIDCRTIIKQNGSLHCLTMQFPLTVKLCAGPEN
jgi:agmatine/peptidylarginine deiminase